MKTKRIIAILVLSFFTGLSILPSPILAIEEEGTEEATEEMGVEEKLERIIEVAQKALEQMRKGKEAVDERKDQEKVDKRLETPASY